MNLPWIKVYKDLPEHPKSDELAARLGDERAWTYVVQMWFWVAKTRPDGELAGVPDHMIASKAGWRGDPAVFVEALFQAGFIDGHEGVRSVHNWLFYQQKHAERREKDRLAKRERRSANPRVLPTVATTVLPTVLPTLPPTVATTVPPTVGTLEKRREREEETSTKNLALFAPAPSAAVEAKPKRAAKAKPEGDEPNVNEDRERWLSQVRTLTGLTESELVPSKAACIRFAQQRKARGMEQLMRALEGLQNDRFAKTAGLGYLLSDDGITKGLAKWKQEAGTTHVSRQYGEIDPELGF